MVRRQRQAHVVLLLLLGLGSANAQSPGAALAPDAGPVSAPALPMGVECPVRPGAPQRVRVAWEQGKDGVRSLVISPTGRVLIGPWWKMPPSFVCGTSSIDVSLSPEQTLPLVIEAGGERVVPDARPLRALLDSLWKARPGSVLDRAQAVQDMVPLYAKLLGRYDSDLYVEAPDLLLREELWSGVAERKQRWSEIRRRFSSTPRGRKLLEEYSEKLRTSAGLPFQLRLEKDLGVSYYAEFSGAASPHPLHPLLYWQGASFCVAQVGRKQCDTEDACKGREVVRCFDTGTKRWGPKRARGVTPPRAPDAPPADSLRGERYTLSGDDLYRGEGGSTPLDAIVRPPLEQGVAYSDSEGLSGWNLLFSEDGRFAVLVVRDRKLLDYDCPPGRISCGGFEVWDDKYKLSLYSVVFDP